ncbi:MAG: copper amine oxidase N-terminal domain-containing protein [Oscillospiraceae bacterium]|nr:copper amine oxidase N-terminal domain-containing protein [Oscillospiraceae bacterium]
MKKKLCIALVLVLVFAAGFVVAAATTGDSQITATLSRTINIAFNGQNQTLTDVNGNQVFPIMFGGSTFLPVRAISQLLDVPVDWDPETRTVLLGDTAAPPTATPAATPIMDAGRWASGSNWTTVQGAANLPHNATIGFRVLPPGAGAGTSSRVFNLDNPADVLAFTLAADAADSANATIRLRIYNAATDVQLLDITIPAGETRELSVELFGAQNLRFSANSAGNFRADRNYFYLLDPTVR